MSNHKPEPDPTVHVDAVIAAPLPPPPSSDAVTPSSTHVDELLMRLREHAQRGYPEALIAFEIAAAVANIYVRIGLRWPEDHAYHARHAVIILDLTDRWEAVDGDGWRKQLFELRPLQDLVDDFRATVGRLIRFGVLPAAIEREMVWYRAAARSTVGFAER